MLSSLRFLVYGFDTDTHRPRLVLLNSDGTWLKDLRGDQASVSKSALSKGPDSKTESYIAPVQLVQHRNSIIVVQNKTDLPLLEVREGGVMRAIHPKLPLGTQISGLISSDGNLFARLSDVKDGSILELDPENGDVIRRFKVADDERGANVACVHENQFLSFEHDAVGSRIVLIPLVGTAERAMNNRF